MKITTRTGTVYKLDENFRVIECPQHLKLRAMGRVAKQVRSFGKTRILVIELPNGASIKTSPITKIEKDEKDVTSKLPISKKEE